MGVLGEVVQVGQVGQVREMGGLREVGEVLWELGQVVR